LRRNLVETIAESSPKKKLQKGKQEKCEKISLAQERSEKVEKKTKKKN